MRAEREAQQKELEGGPFVWVLSEKEAGWRGWYGFAPDLALGFDKGPEPRTAGAKPEGWFREFWIVPSPAMPAPGMEALSLAIVTEPGWPEAYRQSLLAELRGDMPKMHDHMPAHLTFFLATTRPANRRQRSVRRS